MNVMTKLKWALCMLLAIAVVQPAFAASKKDFDVRLAKLAAKFETLQSKPDRKIPAEMLKKAKGVVLMERTKAGFVFAYQGGSGVALLRQGSGWSAPAFLKATEASLGFQVGGQQSFIVILLMHTNAVNMLTSGRFTFGGEASGTAGDQTTGVEGVVDKGETPMLVYTDVAGLYGGAAVKGGAISPDTDANVEYYGEYLSTQDILTGKEAKASANARKLADVLDKAAQPAK